MRLTTASLPFLALASAQTQYLTSLLAPHGDLNTFASALRIAPSSFSGSLGTTSGPITIFAPTNSAFERLNASNSEYQAIENRNSAGVQQILSYHVIQGTYLLGNFTENPVTVRTLSNQTVTIARARSITADLSPPGLIFNSNPAIVSLPLTNIQKVNSTTIPNITIHKVDRLLTTNGSDNGTAGPSPIASRTMTGATPSPTGGAARVGGGLGVAVVVGLALIL